MFTFSDHTYQFLIYLQLFHQNMMKNLSFSNKVGNLKYFAYYNGSSPFLSEYVLFTQSFFHIIFTYICLQIKYED